MVKMRLRQGSAWTTVGRLQRFSDPTAGLRSRVWKENGGKGRRWEWEGKGVGKRALGDGQRRG